MAYSIDQYRKDNNAIYMTKVNGNYCSNKKASLSGNVYKDNCLSYTEGFQKGYNYFLHCWIKREQYDQTFKVKLCKSNESIITSDLEDMQFIRLLKYKGATTMEWIEVTLIFSPIVDGYDSILFELQNKNNSTDTKIIFQELSIFKNLLNNYIFHNYLIKCGIRSNANSLFCINNEEIRLGKSGIFEILDENIQVTFCSPAAALPLNQIGVNKFNQLKNINYNIEDSVLFNYLIDERNYSSFIIDYIYENI